MELHDGTFDIRDKSFKIYARNYAKPSSYIATSGKIEDSFVAEGCSIKGKINHSVISTGCNVEEDVEIYNSVIMPNAVIKKGAIIKYAIVGEGAVVNENAKVGDEPVYYDSKDWGISVVGKGEHIARNSIVKPNEVV